MLHCESEIITDYLAVSPIVNWKHPTIEAKASMLFKPSMTDIEKIQNAFTFVRDQISHSWDIQSERVTCTALETLTAREGICYAKSHLLAALLRSANIPTGFCYQRLLLFDNADSSFCLHALNAVFVESVNRWVRMDARGNKPGVQAEFSLETEKLAFQPDPSKGEYDDMFIRVHPHAETVRVLQENQNAIQMYLHHLPVHL